jgi:GH35 family endo-1,4-beta-xylanase
LKKGLDKSRKLWYNDYTIKQTERKQNTMENKVKKLTKKDHFNAILDYIAKNPAVAFGTITADQMTEFANHEVELLDKKNSSDKKPTKQQEKNEKLAQALLEAMVGNNLYTVTEMTKFPVSVENDLSASKITSLLGSLLKAEQVVRIEEKRRAYFRKNV